MELRHLRYFVALAERLNFTAAAKFLGIKQPPLSVQIRNLETEVGGLLFHRDHRNIRLTPLGLLLLDDARVLLQQASQAEERLRDAVEGRVGEIRIACTQGARSERITRRIRKFLRKQRGARLIIMEVAYEEELAPETSGVDLLITECLEPPAGAIVLERAAIHVAVPPKHRLAENTEISPADLLGETLLFAAFEQRSAAEKYLTELIEKQGPAIEIRAVSAVFSERLWQVSLGLGLTVCTEADRETFDAVRIPLAGAPGLFTVALAHSAARSAALPALLEAIRE